ncbi:hypothetical protein EUGRSUZ_E01522 [Eucalyptus grandis]|uniref:Uncharacterized protein n=2 Tax=Eucalyptus grandis TaxID=71139 RepID=A0ACC3KVF5_EUCGR|nr:hypothetical protein EUGRSUZ_E01522 [Eucalyptus grandis]
MKGIFRSMCSATSSSIRNVFNRLQEIIEYLFETNVANREESSMDNNLTTQAVGSDGSRVRVGEDNV